MQVSFCAVSRIARHSVGVLAVLVVGVVGAAVATLDSGVAPPSMIAACTIAASAGASTAVGTVSGLSVALAAGASLFEPPTEIATITLVAMPMARSAPA